MKFKTEYKKRKFKDVFDSPIIEEKRYKTDETPIEEKENKKFENNSPFTKKLKSNIQNINEISNEVLSKIEKFQKMLLNT